MEDFLGPMTLVPDNPGSFVKLATRGALPASIIASGFSSEEARGVLAGLAAHAIAPFSSPLTGGVALLFGVAAHAYGWPMARGGSQRIAEALAKIILDGGGSIETGRMISSLDELPSNDAVVLDVMPRAAVRIGGAPGQPSRATPADGLEGRSGRVQGRLGPGRPDPVGRRMESPGWDRPCRRDLGAGRRSRRPGPCRDSIRNAPWSSSPNNPDSTPAVRRRGNTPPGVTATSLRALMST